jgi:hypothetical protein
LYLKVSLLILVPVPGSAPLILILVPEGEPIPQLVNSYAPSQSTQRLANTEVECSHDALHGKGLWFTKLKESIKS